MRSPFKYSVFYILAFVSASFAYGQKALPSPASSPAVTAEELLKESDRARGAIQDGMRWQSQVTTIDSDGEKKLTYVVRVKGLDALVEAIEPARNKGETMLFNDRNLWFFRPGLKKPMAISPRQKLMGQAANGDIASTNYYRDYSGKLIGEEYVQNKLCYKLELKAKAKNVTYDGIRYWITKDTRLGIKSEFLTLSGETFKSATMEYGNNVKDKTGNHQTFISQMVIVDALNPKNQTSIVYKSLVFEDQPDKLFNINNISR
jgi:outer membrane lipoprotein-sorting protein